MVAYRGNADDLNILRQIMGCDTADIAWDHLEALRERLGFDYTGIGVIHTAQAAPDLQLQFSSERFNEAVDEYLALGLDAFDPALKRMAQGQDITFTNLLLASEEAQRDNDSVRVLTFLNERHFTAHAAMAIKLPTHVGQGFIGLGCFAQPSDDDFVDRVKRVGTILQLGALAFSQVGLHTGGRSRPNLLTQAEALALEGLANGLSPQEIAEAESKSLSTVRKQLESAKKRLSARNMAQAVALAIELNQIFDRTSQN